MSDTIASLRFVLDQHDVEETLDFFKDKTEEERTKLFPEILKWHREQPNKSNCSPQITPYITFETINDKTVIIVEIRPGQNTPYYLKSVGALDGTYIRVGATTRKAESEKVQELILFGTHRSYDELITKDAEPASKKDIDHLCKIIRRYNGSERPVTVDNLVSWKLLKKEKGELLPSVGFRLLTRNDLHFARIQCALFKGTDRTEFLDRKEFDGSLIDQIEEAYTFVLKHINKGARINGLVREDVYELPIAAIREIIVNAVMHRNYLMHSSIQVSVFADRLEVVSPGGLYAGLTKEEMLSGSSSIRNQILADIFMKMRIVEKWGTGILRIFHLCKEAGLSQPQYTTEGEFVRVELFRPITGKVSSPAKTDTLTENQSDTRPESWPESWPESTANKIISLLYFEEMSKKALADKMNINTGTNSLRLALIDLLQRQIIEFTIPDKPNSRLQKYRITPKGIEYVHNLK